MIRPATFALIATLAAPVGAAELPLWSGTPVTILRTDGTTETAKYHSTSIDPPRLLVFDTSARTWGGGVRTREIPLAEVAQVEGPVGTKFRGKTVLWSTLAGAATGAFIGYLTRPVQHIAVVGPAFGPAPAPGDAGGAVGVGLAAGAVTGAVLGVLLAPTTGHVESWSFTPEGQPVQVPVK